MKKVYFLAALALGISFSNAQEINDDFESYSPGPLFGEHWGTWSGSAGAESIIVSQDFSASGAQAGHIGGDGIQDAILRLGNQFSGVWTFQQKIYVPLGSSGYYNFQEDQNTVDGIWGIEFFIGYIADDFPNNNAYLVATDETTEEAIYLAGYDFPYDTWVTMTYVIDLDEGTIVVNMDGVELYSGDHYLDMAQLGGVDYFSADPSNSIYIDDVVFVEGEMDVNDFNSVSSISVYPTVANEVINVSAKSNISEVAVFNTNGQQVAKVAGNGTSAQVNVSSLPAGVYVVKTIAGKETKTTKVVVK